LSPRFDKKGHIIARPKGRAASGRERFFYPIENKAKVLLPQETWSNNMEYKLPYQEMSMTWKFPSGNSKLSEED
jgi:hypothetical protein